MTCETAINRVRESAPDLFSQFARACESSDIALDVASQWVIAQAIQCDALEDANVDVAEVVRRFIHVHAYGIPARGSVAPSEPSADSPYNPANMPGLAGGDMTVVLLRDESGAIVSTRGSDKSAGELERAHWLDVRRRAREQQRKGKR